MQRMPRIARRILEQLDQAVLQRTGQSGAEDNGALIMPLAELKPSAAVIRTLRFAKPAFFASLALGTLSVAGSLRTETVLVTAVTGLMSLTLIKLFFYLAFIAAGIQVAAHRSPAIGRVVRGITRFMCDVSFDCTSTSLGVICGIYIGAAIEQGFLKTTAVLTYTVLFLVLMNVLLWIIANLDLFTRWLRDNFPALMRWSVGIGVVIAIAGLALLIAEPWREVGAGKKVEGKTASACTSFCLNIQL